MNREEYLRLSEELAEYHEIFKTIWKFSVPEYSNDIDIACIEFNPKTDVLKFKINPVTWFTLDDYSKKFFICHEMLHVILCHSQRSLHNWLYNEVAANIALDLVVNEYLVFYFGFDRKKVKFGEQLCWCDNVLKDVILLKYKHYEYYYNILIRYMANFIVNTGIIKDHGYLYKHNARFTLDKIKSILNSREYDTALSNHRDIGNDNFFKKFLSLTKKNLSQPKKTWESVLQKSVLQTETNASVLTWLRTNRRIQEFMANNNFILPSVYEINTLEKNKYNVWLFLDYSESCAEFRDIFFAAAMSFNPNKFVIRKFGHGADVAEFDKNNNISLKSYSTSFSAIEDFIQNQIKNNIIKEYPDYILHFTDGMAYSFSSAHPERWHVFLVPSGSKDPYPPGTNFHNLYDFI